MKINQRLVILVLSLSILMIGIGTVIGSANINLVDVISIIGYKLFSFPLRAGVENKDVSIIWMIRLPRVLLAFLVGACLSVSGAVIQSLLKNPLASPYTLGVSSGASLGVGICIILGLSIPFIGDFTLPLIGFLSGVITIYSVILFANKVDYTLSNHTMILSGMVFSLFASSFLTLLSALNSENITQITMWQMGSFAMKEWLYVKLLTPFFIVGLWIVFKNCREMDIMSFGEEQAKSVGVEVKQVKTHLLIAISILTGSAIALSGTIGFIDLIIPHMIRKLVGSNHRKVIPMCVMIGGSFMVLMDLISRTLISPSELPVGAITALIGAPFFAYLYFNKKIR